MILRPQDGPVIQVPAAAVASIAVVLPDAGPIRQSVMLMQMGPSDLEGIRDRNPDQRGMPVYWTRWADGRVEVWPGPDAEYLLEIRDVRGMVMGGRPRQHPAKPAAVTPVEHWVEGFRNAARQANDAMSKRPPSTAFPMLAPHGEEE